ncbi:hypothetical protein HK097_002745, partial [Rhizophlyctis rosea]
MAILPTLRQKFRTPVNLGALILKGRQKLTSSTFTLSDSSEDEESDPIHPPKSSSSSGDTRIGGTTGLGGRMPKLSAKGNKKKPLREGHDLKKGPYYVRMWNTILKSIVQSLDYFVPDEIRLRQKGPSESDQVKKLFQTRVTVFLLATLSGFLGMQLVSDMYEIRYGAVNSEQFSVPSQWLSIMDPLSAFGSVGFLVLMFSIKEHWVEVEFAGKVVILFIIFLFTFISTISDAFWKLGHSGFLIAPPFGYFLVSRNFGMIVSYLVVATYTWSFYWSLGRQLPPLTTHQWHWILGDIYVVTCAFYILNIFDDLARYQEGLERDVQHERDVNQAKSRFISSMSHELRTPLHGILATVELLADLCTTDSQRTLLNTIESCGQNLLGIINQVLTYSKAENGTKHQMRIYEFDLFKLVEEVTESLGPVAARKNVKLYQVVDRVSPLVRKAIGPEGCFRQILVNIGNSIKFTEVGSVELILSEEVMPNGIQPPELEEKDEPDVTHRPGLDAEQASTSIARADSVVHPDYLLKCEPHQKVDTSKPVYVVFTLKDTGCGMSPAFLEKIFSPFEQDMSDRLVRASEGTGLGLSIVKLLVDEMQGSIEVESHVGKGSTFTITIPLYHGVEKSWLDPTLEILDGEFITSSRHRRQTFLDHLSKTKLGIWQNPHDARFFQVLVDYCKRWGVTPQIVDDIRSDTVILGKVWNGNGDEEKGAKLKEGDGKVDDEGVLKEKDRMAKMFDRLDVLFIDDDLRQLVYLDRVLKARARPAIVYFTNLTNFGEVCKIAANWSGMVRFVAKPAGPAKILPVLWDILLGREDSLHNAFPHHKQQLIDLSNDIRTDQLRRLDAVTCGAGTCGGDDACQHVKEEDKEDRDELNREWSGETLVVLSEDPVGSIGSLSAVDSREGSDVEERSVAKVKKGPGIVGPVEAGMSAMRVLIVEDNPVNRKILTTFLDRKSLRYTVAVNGQEAVERWVKDRPTVILMDVQMPIMNGIDATARIRDLERDDLKDPQGNEGDLGRDRTNIIVLTGLDNDEDQEAAMTAGADMFMTKPVSMNKLYKCLQDLGREAYTRVRQVPSRDSVVERQKEEEGG